MLRGVSGRLISESFARGVLPFLPGAAAAPADVRRSLDRWWHRCEGTLGPASSVRAVADVAALPLLRLLRYEVGTRADSENLCILRLVAADTAVTVVVCSWSDSLTHAWRRAVLAAVSADSRWCLCFNGRALRIVDGRAYVVAGVSRDRPGDAGRRAARAGPAVDRRTCARHWPARAAARSRRRCCRGRHGADVCRALGAGVLEALGLLVGAISGRSRLPAAVAVRAVAHRALPGAVPALRRGARAGSAVASRLSRPLQPRGHRHRAPVGPARAAACGRRLRAISRLAHAGCSAGDLRVTAFNGRLFAPRRRRPFDAAPIPDDRSWHAVAGARHPYGSRADQRPRPHRLPRSRRRAARRGLRAGARVRAVQHGHGSPWRDAAMCASRADVLHAARRDRLPGAQTLEPLVAAAPREDDPAAAHPRSGDGQRRVPRGGVPLPGRRRRGRADCARATGTARRHARGPSASAPRDGGAVPLRRGPQSDGGAARAAVAVAGDAGGRQAAVVPRSPSGRRRQPGRRRRPTTCACGRAAAARARRPARGVAALRRAGRRAGARAAPSARASTLAAEPDDSAADRPRQGADARGAARHGHAADAWQRVARSLVRRLVLDGRRRRRMPRRCAELGDHPGARPVDAAGARRANRCSSTPRRSRRIAGSCTGRSPFPEVFADAQGAAAGRTPASTPSSAIRRGTWCGATAAMRSRAASAARDARRIHATSSARPASTASSVARTSTAISCSSNARCS